MSLEIALERIKSAKENNDFILDLSNLDLQEIPSEIAELTQLTHLYLENNKISDINALERLRALRVLSLSNNDLIELPEFALTLAIPLYWYNLYSPNLLNLFQALSQAQYITKAIFQLLERAIGQAFERTKNKNIDINREFDHALDHALELDRDIDRNLYRARDIALTISQELTTEVERNLAVNQELYKAIDRALTISSALSKTQELQQTLNKTKAKIHEIQEDRGIYLNDNPFEAPPPEIIQQGNEAIKTFLEEFVEKEFLNEVKVILVGEGASGKTSLVKRLLNITFDKKEQQTHGIKISKHPFNYQDEDFLVNFWDFGGQEIMHATHQFFLTKRCVYVLVLDSRKDEKAEYWLNYIQSFGGDAPVIVVLNKNDENPSFDVNRKFLTKKYNNIQGYYKVSCLTEEGIPALRQDLMDILWNLELRNTAFPRGWFKVKKYLEAMPDDYISYSNYQSICKDNHVPNARSQKVLLELLNDLGVVLNYEKLRLYDTQVLNPLWLTNAVYRIINSPILAQTNGKFNINDLDTIINDPRYQKENPEHWTNIFKFWKPEQKMSRFPEEKFLFIVAMMKQFELLFQIDEFHYLIPGLLSEEENIYQFQPSDSTLVFVFEYMDFLPTSIIPRLMVKLNKYIYNNQVWKTGMVLEEKLLFNSIANIVLDKENRKINIEIKGKRNRDFLTVIRETLKEINSSYQGLDVTEWIPLPELYNDEQLLVDYLELLGYEAAGQLQYFSGKLRKPFPVEALLNGIEKPEARKEFNSIHIFVSYSHKDQTHKEKLTEHLMPLVRLNKATLWDDTCIDAGEEWNTKIFDNLNKADIVLCLISSSFIASDFCFEKELAQAIEAHKNGIKKVIPIRIKEVNWDNMDIAKIQGLPSDKWMSDISDNKSWTEISKGIEKVIESIKKQK